MRTPHATSPKAGPNVLSPSAGPSLSPSPGSGLSPELKAKIDALVAQDPVVLFMKGSRQMPRCGFSAAVVDILDEHLEDYRTVDVLADAEIRDAIKVYSDWPTIPQLFLAGEFVGGADIVQEMNRSGELGPALREARERRSPLAQNVAAQQVAADGPPALTFSDAAIAAALESRSDGDGPYLRFEVTPEFQHALTFDTKNPDDFVVELGSGLTLVIDKWSAARAGGVTVDFVAEGEKNGFKIENPNAKKPAAEGRLDGPAPAVPSDPPALTLTDAALAQFQGAIAEEEGEGPFGIRVLAKRMGATQCEYELDVLAQKDRDEGSLEHTIAGLTLWMDPYSARNLDGATIDFVETERGAGFKFENPRIKQGWGDPRATRFEQLLDTEINPGIAAHGGVVQLLDLQGDTAWLLMGGGCQGCGMAGVTLNQGIEQRVREVIPSIEHLVDTTDHASGTNPYYARRG